MPKDKVRKGVVRVQGDKLCALLGYEKGTKIPRDIIEKIAKSETGDIIEINGTSITLGPSPIGLAQILLNKDVVDV